MVELVAAFVDLIIAVVENPPDLVAYIASAITVLITVPSFLPSFVSISRPAQFIFEAVRNLNFFVMLTVIIAMLVAGADLAESLTIGINWTSILNIRAVDYELARL